VKYDRTFEFRKMWTEFDFTFKPDKIIVSDFPREEAGGFFSIF
jgi:hypothetical protein